MNIFKCAIGIAAGTVLNSVAGYYYKRNPDTAKSVVNLVKAKMRIDVGTALIYELMRLDSEMTADTVHDEILSKAESIVKESVENSKKPDYEDEFPFSNRTAFMVFMVSIRCAINGDMSLKKADSCASGCEFTMGGTKIQGKNILDRILWAINPDTEGTPQSA